jgi:hypothetical protein
MKHYLITILLISAAFSHSLSAQVRHVKGIDMLGFEIGTLSQGFTTGISWQNYIEQFLSMKLGCFYELYSIKHFRYNQYSFNVEAAFTLLSNHKSLYFNATGGLIAGFDRITSQGIGYDSNALVIGEKLGLNAEVFFTPSLKLDIGISQRIFQKNQRESFDLLFLTGLYFTF